MMDSFYPAELVRAKAALGDAERAIYQARGFCEEAGTYLLDAGRTTQYTAIEMICASLNQSAEDIEKWKEMILKTRENGHG